MGKVKYLFFVANPKHLDILRQDVAAWGTWRKENPSVTPNLSGADLRGADLRDANFSQTNLSRANLRRADLRRADLSDAKLSETSLQRAKLSEANLRGARLDDAKLQRAKLDDANLSGADLSEANIAEADLRKANLNGANLGEADLIRADLSGADLGGADLGGANLSEADLSRADLNRANLGGARLRGAHLNRTTLNGADLTGAYLDEANFRQAELRAADLSKSILGETLFADIDLRAVVGLESCKHLAPSTLDHRTLSRSGSLPLSFLRGCGLPDTLIEYLPSIFSRPIQFYSCFISYSTKDQEFADRLHADLQSKGVRCWFAPHKMQSGKKIHEQIDEAIRVYDRLLLILSSASMESEWVKTEIAKARKRELQEKRRMLFPVRLVAIGTLREWECFDSDTGKDSAREVREYYVPDFSNWKNHDAYKEEFAKLLRDLKPDAKPTSAK